MVSATSAAAAMALPLVDMLDLYDEIASVMEEMKTARENGGELP